MGSVGRDDTGNGQPGPPDVTGFCGSLGLEGLLPPLGVFGPGELGRLGCGNGLGYGAGWLPPCATASDAHDAMHAAAISHRPLKP